MHAAFRVDIGLANDRPYFSQRQGLRVRLLIDDLSSYGRPENGEAVLTFPHLTRCIRRPAAIGQLVVIRLLGGLSCR